MLARSYFIDVVLQNSKKEDECLSQNEDDQFLLLEKIYVKSI